VNVSKNKNRQNYIFLEEERTPQTGWEEFVRGVKRAFKVELLNGLRLTFGVFRRTFWGENKEYHALSYPLEKYEMSPRYRAVHKLNAMLESGNDRCIGCGLCEKICVAQCIRIDTYVDENNRKAIGEYSLNLGRCIYCGYCAEVCPELAIVHGNDYENASEQRAHFTIKNDMTTPIDRLVYQKEFVGYGSVSNDADSLIKKTPTAY
jgi:NADH-quinone oxidoreductase subunit I